MGTTFRVVLYAADEAAAKKAADAAFARVAGTRQLHERLQADQRTHAPVQAVRDRNRRAGEGQRRPLPRSREGRRTLEEVGRRVRRHGRPGRATLAARPADAGTPRPEGVRLRPREGRLRRRSSSTPRRRPCNSRRQECNSTSAASPRATPRTKCSSSSARSSASHPHSSRPRATSPAATRRRARTSGPIDIAPIAKSQKPRTLRLANAAVSTSGDLEQFVVIGGVRYSPRPRPEDRPRPHRPAKRHRDRPQRHHRRQHDEGRQRLDRRERR